jgi:hypothetical protein
LPLCALQRRVAVKDDSKQVIVGAAVGLIAALRVAMFIGDWI